MAEAAGDRCLMFRCFHNRGYCFIPRRAFAPSEIDLAIAGERIAVITIVAGIGGRRVALDQMLDGELVLHGAQAVFQRMRCAHVEFPHTKTRMGKSYTRHSSLATGDRAIC